MSKNTMFVDYEWQDSISGWRVSAKCSRVYSSAESTERMVDDVLKIMKGKYDACVTFTCFTGYESIDLLRIFKKWNGLIDKVVFDRNEKEISENLVINKKAVRLAVEQALLMFNDIESL